MVELSGIYAERKIHPNPPVDKNMKWVLRMGLPSSKLPLEKIAAIDCGNLAALTNPNADETVVELVADLLTFLFVFDDLLGEDSATEEQQKACYESFLKLLRDGVLPADATPLHDALADLKIRVDRVYPFPERFYEAFKSYFEGCVAEAFYRRNDTTAELDSYISWREKCIGLYPVLALLEVGLPVAGEEYERSDFQRSRTLAALIISAVNDVFSLRKEKDQGETSNFVMVIKNTEGVAEPEAIERTLALHDRFLAEFMELKIIVDSQCTAAPKKYLEGLLDWMRGNYWWSKGCVRYQ